MHLFDYHARILMKTIYLLRHAKSDWNAPYGADHERPLNDRGIRSARQLGLYLKENVAPPEIILCSTATRTRETLDLVLKSTYWTSTVQHKSELYLCGRSDYARAMSELDSEIQSVLIVGHQPTTGEVASWLLGGQAVEVPTGTFMVFSLAIPSWEALRPGTAKLELHVTPRQLFG